MKHAFTKQASALTILTVLTAGAFLCIGRFAWATPPDDLIPTPKNAQDAAANSFIFVFDDNRIDSEDVPGLAKGLAENHGGIVSHIYLNALRGFAAKISAQGASKLAENNPDILFYEPDGVAYIIEPPSVSKKCSTPPCGNNNTEEPPPEEPLSECTPEEGQWGIKRVGGARSGTGLHAWIIDTGIDKNHPELNVGNGKNFVSGKNTVEDGHGHGTHVSGIVAAKSCVNVSENVIGVAAGATVHPARVLDNSGSGAWSWVIAGIDWVAGNGQSGDCANMSLGGSPNAAVDLAVKNAAATGILFALAAGNNNDYANNHSPARAEGTNIYTISASDINDKLASFSNYGNPPVDYAAPGVSIKSTYKRGGYTTWSGTSMAAPHACGLLLLDGVAGLHSLPTEGVVSGDKDGTPDAIVSTGSSL